MTLDRIDVILAAMPATRRDLQERLGISKGALQNLIEKLHKAGWCYVSGWERANINGVGKFLVRFAAGHGRDKPCTLAPMTQQERDDRRFRKAIKTGAIEERRKKNVMRYYERRAKKKTNTWASALFDIKGK